MAVQRGVEHAFYFGHSRFFRKIFENRFRRFCISHSIDVAILSNIDVLVILVETGQNGVKIGFESTKSAKSSVFSRFDEMQIIHFIRIWKQHSIDLEILSNIDVLVIFIETW
jgi:hypothetical protein